MNKRITTVFIALMVMVGAGCSSAPVVVHDIPIEVTPILKAAPDSLLVLPLSGLSARVGIAMGIRTAWALRQAGYPARHVTVSDGISPILTGWISEGSSSSDIVWLDIDWAAYGTNGALIGKYEQKTAVPRAGWERLSSETFGAVIIEAMTGIDTLIRAEMYPPGSSRASSLMSSLPNMTMPGLAGPADQNVETVIVSGEGIAKVDGSGREIWEPLVSVTADSDTGPFSSEKQQKIIQLIDPSTRNVPLDAYISEGLVEEYAENINTDLPAVDQFDTPPPPDSDVKAEQPQQTQQPVVVASATEVPILEEIPEQMPEPVSAPVTTAFAPTTYRPVFMVRQSSGAPGDGNLALRDAMRKALRQNDAMVSDDMSKVSHIVQGTVRIEVPFAGRQRVRIVWMVTNTAGVEMGTALQENDVPEGSLNKKWGPVAQKIANSAVLGIAQLFDTGLDSGLDSGGAGGKLSQPDLPHLQ